MFEVNDIPPIYGRELQELIDENVEHNEYLFFRRTYGDENDWIIDAPDGYECFCTHCQTRFFVPLADGPLLHRTTCPQCAAPVKARLWNKSKGIAATAFAVHLWQRGSGRSVWLSSIQVRLNPDFLEGKYCAYEYARYVYYDGGSRKWTRDGWTGEWHSVKNKKLKHWQSTYSTYPDHFLLSGTLDGSCLEYSCLERAIYILNDPAEYCALYVRQPMLEYLWKMGLGHWLREREQYTGAFSQCVNLRAKLPERFIRLTKPELRAVRKARLTLVQTLAFRELRALNAVQPDAAGTEFARCLYASGVDFARLIRRTEVPARELVKYIRRQAKRTGGSEATALQELCDYLDQLERMQIGGEKLPHDLHEAHARLSERERRLMNREKNEKFRTRRHLLAWMRWKYKGMFIRPIDSAEEIVREGEEQNNCVAGYAGRHADGKTIIMVLRKRSEPRKPWHTVEIDPKTLVCRQCYAAHNRARTPEAAEFMDKYLDHLREVTKMIRRSA